jgi:hypothetical protein
MHGYLACANAFGYQLKTQMEFSGIHGRLNGLFSNFGR